MFVYDAARSAVAVATLAGALLAGCADPEEPTDLRSQDSGPPNVTTVTVMSDLISSVDPNVPGLPRLIETATHCRTGDDKRPGLVGLPNFTTTQVCPETLSQPAELENLAEGAPPSWFVRVVFDKLLDPNVEDLVPQLDTMGNPTGVTIGTFADTQPVKLLCGLGNTLTPVPYNGYYVPNGNRVSWPLGPALFVAPLSPISVPTGALCSIQLNDNVTNKRGQAVADDQRTFTFKIAPMKYRFSIPDASQPMAGDGSIVQDPGTPVQFYWTAQPEVTGDAVLDPAKIHIRKGPNLNTTATTDGDPDPDVCANTGGTVVAAADITTKLEGDGSDADSSDSTALIMDLSTTATSAEDAWEPQTTYLIEFAGDAAVSPLQGGADGTFPTGFKLCFHTAAPAPM